MLSISGLSISFQGNPILKDLSFSVGTGQTVGLIGPNGSGKTTLFNTISGFVQASSGQVILNGKEIQGLEPHQRARLGLGRVFQNFGIFSQMTLLENILIALEARANVSGSAVSRVGAVRERRAEAMKYLDDIRLAQKALDKAGSLSGGQMRLLEIMRTVAAGAELFLLDEPTAGVSPRMKDDVAGIIRKLQELGKTVLIIEHDIIFIQRFCTRIVVLNEGQIVLDDTPEKVRSNERLKDIYFGRDAEDARPGATAP